jgi:hypothetical protein
MLDHEIGKQKTPDSALRRLLTASIKRSGKTRAEIAAEMTLHTGQRISKRMVNDWTAESKKPARFPAAFVATFCEVTGSDEPQRYLLGARLRELVELGDRTVEWAWAVRKVRKELAKLDGQGQKRSRKTRRRTA